MFFYCTVQVKKNYFHGLLSAIASMTIGSIHKIIHVIGVVAIENINICFPIAIIITAAFKADFPGDHPFTRGGMPTRQPASSNGATVIIFNRTIDDLFAGLTHNAVPAGSLPVRCDMARFLLITTIVSIAHVGFRGLEVPCGGV